MLDHNHEIGAAYRRLAFAADAGDALAQAVGRAEADIALAAGCQTDFDREATRDALADEICFMIAGTSSYDPLKRKILPYLKLVARRKLRNAWRDERRRRGHVAALLAAATENSVAEDAPVGNDAAEAEWEAVHLQKARAVLDETDYRHLLAVRDGAPDAALAANLGVSLDELPAARRRAVERIRKRLQRGGLL